MNSLRLLTRYHGRGSSGRTARIVSLTAFFWLSQMAILHSVENGITDKKKFEATMREDVVECRSLLHRTNALLLPRTAN